MNTTLRFAPVAVARGTSPAPLRCTASGADVRTPVCSSSTQTAAARPRHTLDVPACRLPPQRAQDARRGPRLCVVMTSSPALTPSTELAETLPEPAAAVQRTRQYSSRAIPDAEATPINTDRITLRAGLAALRAARSSGVPESQAHQLGPCVLVTSGLALDRATAGGRRETSHVRCRATRFLPFSRAPVLLISYERDSFAHREC